MRRGFVSSNYRRNKQRWLAASQLRREWQVSTLYEGLAASKGSLIQTFILCRARGTFSYAKVRPDFMVPPTLADGWGCGGEDFYPHTKALANLLKMLVDAVGIEPTTPPV